MSGTGTILEAMLHAGIDVALVASDRPCRGLEIAEHAGIPALLIDRAEYGGFTKSFDRDVYSDALTKVLRSNNIDLIAMAGFGTITSGVFHEAFPGRVLNTHPSLLPDFKGWHAVKMALDAGAKESGPRPGYQYLAMMTRARFMRELKKSNVISIPQWSVG